MMRGRQHIRPDRFFDPEQELVPQQPCRRFEREPVLLRILRHVLLFAEYQDPVHAAELAAEGFVLIRRRSDAVVEMGGKQLEAEFLSERAEDQQKRGGIGAAAQRRKHLFAGRDESFFDYLSADPFDHYQNFSLCRGL